ncbi:MAG: DUF4198 domain-containing protein [Defluviitaleaceae bacterium]|nr:DUF4198 domain-containing protein [Defluviitaleaceae bacterium]
MKSKKYFALFLAILMAIASIPFTAMQATAQEVEPFRAPRVALNVIKITSVDALPEVPTDEIFDVTVIFRSVLAPNGEPFTITATGGAEILINNPSDVTAMMGANPGTIRDITNQDGVVRFMTSTPGLPTQENIVTFQVRAPSTAGDFAISTKIGLDNTPQQPGINFVARSMIAAPQFYAESSHDVVIGNEPFDIFGNTNTENPLGLNMIILTVMRPGAITPAIERVFPTNFDGSFQYAGLIFPSNAVEGMYIVTVVWMDFATFAENGRVEFEIEFKLPPFEVWPSIDVVYNDTPFDILGSVGSAPTDIMNVVVFSVRHKVTNAEAFGQMAFVNPDGSFITPGIVFPANAEEGMYLIEATWMNLNTFEEYRAITNVVEFRRSAPASITVNTSVNIVITEEMFSIFGVASPYNDHTIRFSVTHEATGEVIFTYNYPMSSTNFNWSFGFSPIRPDGIYLISVVLVNNAGDDIASAQTTVELRNPPQANNIPDRVRLDANLTGVTFITSYPAPFRNIFRAGQNTPITISGVATFNGQPVEGAQIRVGLWYWAWNIPQNRHRYEIVTTDANGRFSQVIRVPNGLALSERRYIHWVPSASSIHILEEALIYAEAVNNLSAFDERELFVLAGIR